MRKLLGQWMVVATVAMSAIGIAAAAPGAQAAPAAAVAYPGEPIVVGEEQCTIGLTGYVGTARYAVTAGHCAKQGKVTDNQGKPLGWFESSRPDKYDDYGFGLIRLYDNVTVSASMGSYGLSTVNPNPAVGQTICKLGARTGWSCGKIIEITAKHVYATKNLTSESGDSGGVVFHQTADKQAAFVGLVMGYRADDHVAVVEPAGWLFDQIRRYGPTKKDRFIWYRV